MATIITIYICFLLSVVTTIHSQNITFILQEDRPNSTLIGNIFTESKLAEKFDQDKLSGITYDFMEKEEYKHLFRLDSVSSNLYTNTVIDREKDGICLYLADCHFDFRILAYNNKITEIIETRVNITDLNDHPPRFQTNTFVLNISETQAQFSKIPIAGATDLDTGKDNGVKSYRLNSQSGKDDLQLVQETVDKNIALYISVHNELDRETTSSYVLYLQAMDGGNPTRTGTLTIQVNVLDENDNKPSFTETEVDVNLDETSPAGTLVKHLTATDPDSGKNGQIFYRLKNFQHKEINDSFLVDSAGKLLTTRKLEYEPNKVYKVIVEAVDKGSNPLSSQATVNVHVQDSGNNAPEVSVNFLSNQLDGDAVVISELTDINVLVAVIKVKDTDSGENGIVSCFTYNTYFGLLKMTETDYRLIVQHKLDRESMEVHNVTVTCKDRGQPQMDGSVNFQIILKDENDNPPRFPVHHYQTSLLENTPVGHSLLTVTATDLDSGDNSKITYEMSPATDNRFTVDAKSGVVRTNSVFDKETISHVTFYVAARDHGNPSIESKATVVVDLVDVNDNKPEFVKMMYDFQVSENMPNGTAVDSVSAIDTDEGANGQIVYSLDTNLDPSTVPFNVFSTGHITTRKIFNREDQPQYQFTVIAVDKGSPSLTSSVTVLVKINDKNDNHPIFSYPKGVNNTVLIWSSLPVDSIIATIQAHDIDFGENGNVNFFIIAGDVENMFYLNPSTGSLHVKKLSAASGNKTFKLKIEARDRGFPSLNTTAELMIVVQHANVSQPESKEYILIVVSVVCVTFVVAVALIAVICFLRNKSIACGKNERYVDNNRPPQYDDVKANSKNYNYPYTVQNDKNKQQVKFNQPGSTFTKQEMMDNLTLVSRVAIVK